MKDRSAMNDEKRLPRPCSAAAPCSRASPRLPAASSDARSGRGAGRAAAVVERRAGEAGDLRLRPRDHRPHQPELCPSRRPHRRVRPRRDAVGRAPALHPVRVLPRARPGGRGAEARIEEHRAVQDRAVGKPRGDREAFGAGLREDRLRDADRHDGRAVRRRGADLARNARGTHDGTGLTPISSTSR